MSGETERESLVELADDAYEAIRAINHATITCPRGLPAPIVYGMLGSLKLGMGYSLNQALNQLGDNLARSLDHYDVYEDDGREPAESVAIARDHMLAAAALAAQIGEHLAAAQNAIARQGYRD